MRCFNKIFCIGFPKTGTTSLHHALQELGLRSIHHGFDSPGDLKAHLESARHINQEIRQAVRDGADLLACIPDYDAYTDIGAVRTHYKLLDSQYKGSLFIYTTRDKSSWLRSLQAHINRRTREKLLSEGKAPRDPYEILIERQAFETDIDVYFEARPEDLLKLDVSDENAFPRLCRFLQVPVLAKAFPRRNVAKQARPAPIIPSESAAN
jgi:hypothetical protein